jgi:hypothetical protein
MGKRQRGLALMKRLLELQAETAAVEAELDALFVVKPRATRQRKAASSNGNGAGDLSVRGALTVAIRKVFAQRGEWTAREIAEKVGVPADRVGSAKAAVSRMFVDGEIEKGTTAGTYRAKASATKKTHARDTEERTM